MIDDPTSASVGRPVPPSVRDPRRLEALRETALLDSPAEEEFDRLTRVAAWLLDAEVALVSLVDEDRQFFKSAFGLDEPWSTRRETPLSHSFCMHAVESREPLVVDDARSHPIFAGHPAIRDLNCVGYAGIPLVTDEGYALGTLCVLQSEPRGWRKDEIRVLEDLAAGVMTSIELRAELRERRRVEAERRAAEERLRWTLELSPAVIYTLEVRQGSFVPASVSGNVERLFGYTMEEAVKPDWWLTHLHPADRAGALEAMDRLMEEGAVTHRYRFRTAGGGYRWVRDDLRLVGGEGDRPDRLAGAWVDITARKEAEDALRESFLRSHVEQASGMITVVDGDGVILYESPSVERILGRDPARMVGRSVFEFVHPDDRERIVLRFREFLRRPDVPELMEFRLQHADGSWRLVQAAGNNCLDDPEVRGVILNSWDMTEVRSLERQLHQAQKMEALGSLAGGVAHDFNNVLAVIAGHVGLLASDLSDEPGLKDDLEEIRAATERGTSLTRQLLAFSRQEALEVRRVSVNDTVNRIEPMLRRLLGPGVELRTELSEGARPVLIDPGHLDQILMNLTVNARDAMPDGGDLVIRTREVDLSPGLAQLPGVKAGAHVVLEVDDSGGGIPPGVLEKIFEPFFTTKEKGKGTGLGLSTVYRIVQQSGGQITVESDVGKGTRFRIHLPAAPDAS